jgi:hypothetical protein
LLLPKFSFCPCFFPCSLMRPTCSHPSFGVKCQSQSESTRLSYFPISGTVCNHHSTHLDLSPFTDLAQNATMASSPFATAGFSAAVHCLVQQRLCLSLHRPCRGNGQPNCRWPNV